MMFSSLSSLEIRETAKDLQILLVQHQQPDLRDKIAALYLLKLGKAKPVADLTRIIGQDCDTVENWFQTYDSQGLTALLTG